MQVKGWQGGIIRLRWSKSARGYELREHDEFYDELPWAPENETPPYICPIGGSGGPKIEFDLSTAESGRIINQLVNMADSDEAILGFTNEWGQLERVENSKKALLEFRDQLRRVYRNRSKFSELEKMISGQTLGQADIEFGRRAKGRGPVDLRWYVSSLRDLCWLGVVEDLGGIKGSLLVRCLDCGKWFQKRGLKGPAPKHCSNACRQRAHREKKETDEKAQDRFLK